MSKTPNPYDTNKVVGSHAGSTNRAIVVNIMDPEKTGRVQIRVVGHMDDEAEIPDEKLPWVKVRNSTFTPSLQTATVSHGLLPGSMVTCEAMGMHGADYLVTGTIPNDRTDDNQTRNSATLGKGATDNMHPVGQNSTAQKGDGRHGWKDPVKQVHEQKTTKEARARRDTDGREGRKSEKDRIKKAHDEDPAPEPYQRTTSKDPKGGTVGVFKFQGKDPQQFIQQTIQNASAVVPNALSALMNLKKVNGNPTSIESIGAGNFQQILSQLSALFSKNGGSNSKQDSQSHDCSFLITADDATLTPEQLTQKATCILLQNANTATS